ncbi:MAG: nucleotidyltransferase family protein [Thermomonas sp.]|uniref:nucleotidyltransferase family protein n=1 Tax=Thermomonas sp. TaxID=1971895 RepID=UPI0026209780|nr:nucleotidyltransferase family protein [Thermomonas sp.]MCC7097656.1 nucleotidyltransferase family protein [Thermomonas sp.]
MDDAALRDWLAAALRSGRPPPLSDSVTGQQLLEAAEREGVTALLEARLRTEGGWAALTDDQRDALQAQARGLAAQWLLRANELHQIEQVLVAAGLRALLLKGAALSLWLYPQPFLRMGGDIDLLLDSAEATAQAETVLAPLGYARAFDPGDTHFELTLRCNVDGQLQSELDLHSRLLNAAAYAGIFGFDELWTSAQALPGMGTSLRALSPAHALAHACLNRALDMQNAIPDRLKLLYDLRLLAVRNSAQEWEDLCTLAADKRIAGLCLRSLEDAARTLGAEIPAEVSACLCTLASDEPLDADRLADWRYMQWQNLRALPSFGARLHWLRQRLFPGREQLRTLYGEGPTWRLVLRRLRRGLARLFK